MAEQRIGRGLIDREVTDGIVRENFAKGLECLRTVVDEGETIVRRITEGEEPMDSADRIIVGHLFVHFLTELDGTEVLLSRACSYSARCLLRSLVESAASIHWILKSDTETRAKRYLVGYYRSQLHSAETQMAEASAERKALWQEGIDGFKKAITSRDLKSTNDLFERERPRRGGERSWYALDGGPQYMKQLIRESGLPPQLSFFWDRWSGYNHGMTMDLHTRVHDGIITLDPVRDPQGIKNDAWMAVTLAYGTYRAVCTRSLRPYLVHLTARFRRWYATIRAMPEVELRSAER